jgi:hypothetical protein
VRVGYLRKFNASSKGRRPLFDFQMTLPICFTWGKTKHRINQGFPTGGSLIDKVWIWKHSYGEAA